MSSTLSKKKKTSRGSSAKDAKKKCDTDIEVVEDESVSLAGLDKDQPCRPL